MSCIRSSYRASLCISALCLVLTIAACSPNADTRPANAAGPGASTAGTGGVAFRLTWTQPPARAKALSAPAFNACVDYSITTITAAVSDGTATVASGSWPCSAHEGLLLGVPAGANYLVQISGLSSAPTVTIWTGTVSAVTVHAGQITNAGSVVMSYAGADITRPTVVSLAPRSDATRTTDVPLTDRFVIIFDKPMAVSTLTASSIQLVNTSDASTVPGIVSYAAASTAAAFAPSANLAPLTTYALQVLSCVTATTCITDQAGNWLASDATGTFTTEPAPVGAPAAPSGVTIVAGNGQVTLDWLATGVTTSYNVYYSTAPLVTTTTGTPLLRVRAPFVHLGLANGTAYHYIVTALNNVIESSASAEVSATPLFPASDPLPPAGITVVPSTGQNSVTWLPVAGALSYNLYWSTMPIMPDKYAADHVIRGAASPFVHSGIADGQLYCYVISAMNATGESADSLQACGGIGAVQFIW